MTSLLAVIASGAVGFIDWLDELLVRRKAKGSWWQSR